ncbi:MAG: ACT domain-containing protein [Eubacterium sp.]|nr:ACT domain-containing protein [Eubacterium sp.]
MYIDQISVFVENKPGKLFDLTNFIAEKNINMRALEVADASDYGIIRFIVDDPTAMINALKENDWVCNVTKVIGVKIPDKPGSLAKISNILSDANTNVEYCYAFISKENNNAIMVFKVDDNEEVVNILKANGAELVSQKEIANI